jgi:aerobic-type carbon monoxide dehydrogenase small subunit (CoxS/CutS family)
MAAGKSPTLQKEAVKKRLAQVGFCGAGKILSLAPVLLGSIPSFPGPPVL